MRKGFNGASTTHYAGSKARALRAHWTGRIRAAGVLPCRRCGKPVTLAMAWDVGHIVDRALGGADTVENTWPEHRGCNQKAGAKLGAARKNARTPAVVRRLESEQDRGIRGF